LLNIPWLQTVDLQPDVDDFLEVLVNNIRNEVTSFQAFFSKGKNARILEVKDTLKTLKRNYHEHEHEIRTLEGALNDIMDSDMRSELENYEWFEHISAEKMSPKFLDLAKQTKQSENLSEIKKTDGSNFVSDTDRNNFIRNYYSNIYKKVGGDVNPYVGCIEEFLGPKNL
jgi:hypothetical protein